MSELFFPAPLAIRSFLSAPRATSHNIAVHSATASAPLGDRKSPTPRPATPGRCEGRTLGFRGRRRRWLAFHRSPYRYIVYSAIGRGWHEKAGLAVEKDGRLLTDLRCRGTPISELGPDFFSSAGIPEDETPFDLP